MCILKNHAYIYIYIYIYIILKIATIVWNAFSIFPVFLVSILFLLIAFLFFFFFFFFFRYISYPVLSNSASAYFCYVIKTFKTHFKKQRTLHKQVTPDDGLWRVRKCTGQFCEIHLPIPTWNKDTYLETWKDLE